MEGGGGERPDKPARVPSWLSGISEYLLLLRILLIGLQNDTKRLHVDVEGDAQVAGCDSIYEAIGPQELDGLVGHAADLDISPPLLVGAAEVDIGVGHSIRRSDIPGAGLPLYLLLDSL